MYLKNQGREKSRDSFFKGLKILAWKSEPHHDAITPSSKASSPTSDTTSTSNILSSATSSRNHNDLDYSPRTAMRKKAKSFVQQHKSHNIKKLQNVKLQIDKQFVKQENKHENKRQNRPLNRKSDEMADIQFGDQNLQPEQQFSLQFGVPSSKTNNLMFAPKPSSENLMAWKSQNPHLLKIGKMSSLLRQSATTEVVNV